MLKKSNYNVYVKGEEYHVIHNTLYGGVVRLLPEEYQLLLQEKIVESDDKFSVISRLKENGFLVDENMDEYSSYQKLADLINQMELTKQVFYCVIAGTTECNARCEYCYENGIKKQKMKPETVNRCAAYIRKNCKGRRVDLTWFGGEPLMQTDVIDRISGLLKADKIDFESTIVSNGFLFTNEIIKRAKEDWNLSKVQISIDDLTERYDLVKNYHEMPKGAFEHVMNNIENLIEEGIHVFLRLHIGEKNKARIDEILSYLRKRFRMAKTLVIYPAFLVGEDEIISETERSEIVYKIFCEVPAFSLQWYESWLTENPYIIPCMRADRNAVLIDPEGHILRCENDVGRNWGCTLEDDLDVYKPDYTIAKSCKMCAFFPKCMGGCMADRLNGYKYCSIVKYIIPAVLKNYGR